MAFVAAAACRGEPSGGTPQEETDPAIDIRFVSADIKPYPLFNDATGSAVFGVSNRSGRELGIWGVNGVEPVYRIAVWNGDRWIEDEPTWLECATGLDTGILTPGATVDVDVWIPSEEHEFRFAFGTWQNPGPRDAETRVGILYLSPWWHEWDWVWSETIVLNDAVQE